LGVSLNFNLEAPEEKFTKPPNLDL
jgi:hypothetical protein